MDTLRRPLSDGFSWSGTLEQTDVRSLYAACHSLRFTGRLELKDEHHQAEVLFLGGRPVEISGGDTNAISLWKNGTFHAVQSIPDLAGELTAGREVQGSLSETRPSALWAWIGEYRLTCEIELERPGQRARVRFANGHAESAEVNGQPELAALARVSSWREGQFTVRLRPLFTGGVGPMTAAPPDGDRDGAPPSDPHEFDLSRQVPLVDAELEVAWGQLTPPQGVAVAPEPAPRAAPVPTPPRQSEPRVRRRGRRWVPWAVAGGFAAIAAAAIVGRLSVSAPRSQFAQVKAPPAERPQPKAQTKTPPTEEAGEIAEPPPPRKPRAASGAASGADHWIVKGRFLLVDGHAHSALDAFRRAEKLRPQDPNLAIYEQQAQGKLGRAELVLDGKGAVRIDGKRFTLPKKLRVAAGPHTIDLGGGETEVVLKRGEKRHLRAAR